MNEINNTSEEKEKLILVGIETGTARMESSLLELKELVRTAGAEVVGQVIQNRDIVHPNTYLGKGKIEEIKNLVWETEADGIVCDDELSPAQMKNLEDMLQCKVIDRTILILDIFAQRASTKEGKIQVELAQARYQMTRLVGSGKAMSRLGGGIGTRGPGESKLETDRRRIRTRISFLKKELEDIVKRRDVNRELRKKNQMPVVAVVGYTNAGKSTLLNTLTQAAVLSENLLFATLDPTTRVLTLPSGQQVLLTDTVGFIQKLPHDLIDAFKSTLEEAKYADMIVHVVDASNEDYGAQMDVVYQTLSNLGISDKPVLTLFNKCDVLSQSTEAMMKMLFLQDQKATQVVKGSALTEEGLEEFLEALEKMLKAGKVYMEKTFGFQEASAIQRIRKYGQLLEETYTETGIFVRAYVPKDWI